jgi:hypothetical protein
LGSLQLGPGFAPVLYIVDVIAGVLVRALIRVKDQTVFALLSLNQLPAPTFKIPVTIFRMGK